MTSGSDFRYNSQLCIFFQSCFVWHLLLTGLQLHFQYDFWVTSGTTSGGCWWGVPNPKSQLIFSSNPRSQLTHFRQSQSHFWQSQVITDQPEIPVNFQEPNKGQSQFPTNGHQHPPSGMTSGCTSGNFSWFHSSELLPVKLQELLLLGNVSYPIPCKASLSGKRSGNRPD